MAKAAKRKPAKGCRLPEPLPLGYTVYDSARKNNWTVGQEIGSGGFGRVYLCSAQGTKSEDYVLKVEYHQNGPLFSEIHCYMYVGQENQMSDWSRRNKIPYLGVSPAYGFGSYEENGAKYRFLVLQRYGTDLAKILKQKGNTFSVKNACTIAISILNSLEYIHSFGYLHCDIKAANLLLGRHKSTENQVYLVDMGLALKYIVNGEHRKDVPDPKKAHNGTIEYMSRDAHRGTPCTRRSDFESLCYNILYWLCGNLPWDGVTDCVKVQKLKEESMEDITKFMKKMFPKGDAPSVLSEFFKYVKGLKFDETPSYSSCRKMFEKVIVSQGAKCDGKLNFNDNVHNKTVLFSSSSSSKENVNVAQKGVVKKKTATKRKVEKAPIVMDPSIVLTPAMQAVLGRKK